MDHRRFIALSVLSGIVLCASFVFERAVEGIAASAPPSAPAPVAPSNVHVINVPGVHVLNSPTVHVQEHNWQYRAEVIPKAFPGTPEWNDFLNRLNGYGREGWELVNIVDSVAVMKKGV